MDFIAKLPIEIAHEIFLLIPYEVTECLRVCQSWNTLLGLDSLWCRLLSKPLDVKVYRTITKTYYLKRLCMLPKSIPFTREVYLELCRLPQPVPIILHGLVASTFDHPEQNIDKTLYPSQLSFWSSRGSSWPDNTEYLDYELVDESMVVQVSIKPFLAHYQRGLPVYAPKQVSFRVSSTKDFTNGTVSKRFDINNTPTHQIFRLEPVMIGMYVRIYFHGHANIQPNDHLYYTAIEKVEVYGHVLGVFRQFPLLKQLFQETIPANHDWELQSISEGIEALKVHDWKKVQECMSLALLGSFVRSQSFFDLIQVVVERSGLSFQKWFVEYVSLLFERGIGLSEDESLCLARVCLHENDSDILTRGITDGFIEPTYALGRIFESSAEPQHLTTAYEIYCEGTVFEKILEMSLRLENYRIALEVLVRTYDDTELLEWLHGVYSNYSRHEFRSISALILRFSIHHPGLWDVDVVRAAVAGVLNVPVTTNLEEALLALQ